MMRGSIVALVLTVGLVGCTKTVYVTAPTPTATDSPAVSVTPSPAVSVTASPSPAATVAGWTAEEEEEAATIYASGISKKYALTDRLAAGRCTVAKLKKFYDTFTEWQGTHDHLGLVLQKRPSDWKRLTFEFGVLGTCEIKLGI